MNRSHPATPRRQMQGNVRATAMPLLARTGVPFWIGMVLLAWALGSTLVVYWPMRQAVAAMPREDGTTDGPLSQSAPSSIPLADGDGLRSKSDLTQTLPVRSQLGGILEQVFATARLHEVVIAQAEHAHHGRDRMTEGPEGWPVHEMRLEASAAYQPMRRFINQVVLTQPGVALQQLSASRESIEHGVARWRLVLTVYMRPTP